MASDASAPPARPDWTVDQHHSAYTAEQHRTWQTLFERQARLLPGRACDEFIGGLRQLPIDHDRIPDFAELSDMLRPRTGWSVVAVPGLVPDEVFFDHLAHRRFPAGCFIRGAHQLDYLQEPDVFHDVFGHVPMLMNPKMADFLQAYGEGGLRAQRLGTLDQLARVYWYTVEFGLVLQAGTLRTYGAGIASSYTETVFALDDPSPNRVRFDLHRVMRTRYRIDDFQETYFVIDSLGALLDLARIDFAPLYQVVSREPALDPGELQPGDDILHRGTGAHAASTRAA